MYHEKENSSWYSLRVGKQGFVGWVNTLSLVLFLLWNFNKGFNTWIIDSTCFMFYYDVTIIEHCLETKLWILFNFNGISWGNYMGTLIFHRRFNTTHNWETCFYNKTATSVKQHGNVKGAIWRHYSKNRSEKCL